jgi:hypothetical protein
LRDRCVQKIGAKPEAGRQGCDLASPVDVEMFDHPVRPPTGFRGYVGCLSSPLRGGHRAALSLIQPDLAFARVEVGNHAKKKTLAGSRRTGDGGARAGAEVQFERAGERAAEIFDKECRCHRIA